MFRSFLDRARQSYKYMRPGLRYIPKSKGQARNLIKQGGVYVNNERIDDDALSLKLENLASESVIILRAGKKKYGLLVFNG